MIEHQHTHRTLLSEVLFLQTAVDVEIAIDQLNSFARQSDDTLNKGLSWLTQVAKNHNFPTPRATELERILVDQ